MYYLYFERSCSAWIARIMVTNVLLVLWILIIIFYFVTGDKKGSKIQITLRPEFVFEGVVETCCQQLIVNHDNCGDCNGKYALSNKSVSWAPRKPVYKHLSKDR